jgi:hypothetical protein
MSLIICCSRLLTLHWARKHKLLVQPSPPKEGSADAREGRAWPTPEDAFYILRARLVVLFAASLFVVALCFGVGSIGAVTLFAVPVAPMIAKYIPLEFFRPLKREKEVRFGWQCSVWRRLLAVASKKAADRRKMQLTGDTPLLVHYTGQPLGQRLIYSAPRRCLFYPCNVARTAAGQ